MRQEPRSKPKIKRVVLRLFRKRRKPVGPVLTDWMVVRVKPNHERSAVHWMRKIAGDHIETFMPYVEFPGSRGKQVALFPGFVFVRPHTAWFYIKSTPGVLDPILMAGEPARMPIRDMQLLMRATDKEGVLRVESDTYAKGDDIRAHSGTFQNVWGVYIGDGSKRGRVRVLYQILSRPVEVEYARDEVTSAPVLTEGTPIALHDWRALGGARPKTKKAPV